MDRQSCQSSGACVRAAPGAFALDADHLAEARPEAGELPRERLLEIARDCPAMAIHLYESSGEEIDPFD